MYVSKVYDYDELNKGKKDICGIVLSNAHWNTRTKYMHNGIFYDIKLKKYFILHNSMWEDDTESDNFFDALCIYKQMAKKFPDQYNLDEKVLQRFITKISLYEKGKLV